MDDHQIVADIIDVVMALAHEIASRSCGPADFHPEEPFVDAGFSSLDMANLMIAVEARFDIMIPTSYLTPANFRSVRAVALMVASIKPLHTTTVGAFRDADVSMDVADTRSSS